MQNQLQQAIVRVSYATWLILLVTILLVTIVHLRAADPLDTWSMHKVPAKYGLTDIACGGALSGGRQVVVVGPRGANGAVYATSLDGVHWAGREFGGTPPRPCIAWGGGRYVVMTGSTEMTVLTSFDGVNWAAIADEVEWYPSCVIWAGNQFVAFGNASFTMASYTSPDGQTWTRHAPQSWFPFWGIAGLAWNGDLLVAAGRALVGKSFIATSTDGIKWTRRFSGTNLNCVTYGGGKFVVLGENGTAFTSTNGIHWELHSSGPTNYYYSRVTWGAGWFVAVGNHGSIVTSRDGVNWTRRPSGCTNDLRGVTWNGSQFVAVGGNNEGIILNSGAFESPPNSNDATRTKPGR